MRCTLAILATLATAAQSDVPAPSVVIPELVKDHTDENCVVYTNYTQPELTDTEVVYIALGRVIFKLDRVAGAGYDVAEIWSTPPGVIGSPLSIELPEYASAVFCFSEYEGS